MPRRRTMECNQGLMKSPSGTLPDFGAIFMSNRSTKEECLRTKLFGLPLTSASFVEKVKIGMVLFLFEHEERKLYGVFEAISDGALNIVPHAYSSSGKHFSAQVRISTIWCCQPLSEHDFHDAIKDNYYAAYKFHFGLSKDQVHRLLWLFDSKKVRIRKSLKVLTKTKVVKGCQKSLRKGGAVEKGRSVTADISRENLHMNIDEVVIVAGDTNLSDSSLNRSANSDLAIHEKDNSLPESVHKLSFKDSILTCKPSDTPRVQYSSVFGTGFGSTSVHEIGAHCSDAFKSQSNSLLDLEQNVDMSSSSLTTDLEDYIPLLSPDHCDPIETAFPLFDNADNPIFPIIPETSSSHQAVDCSTVGFPPSSTVDCCLKEKAPHLESQSIHNGETDYNDVYQSVRGLYSDSLKKRNSVFSRLTLTSKPIVQEQEEITIVGQSVQEIMDKLQQRHNHWKKKMREAKYNGCGNEDNTRKRKRSVFSRLTLASKNFDDQEPQDAWRNGRIAKDSKCHHFKRKNLLLKTQSVATGRPCSDLPECNSIENQCKHRRLVRPPSREKSGITCQKCPHEQMLSQESSASKESARSCEPPINRSDRVDDALNQSCQENLLLCIKNSVSCEFESKKAGEMLTNKDLSLVEMVSTVNCNLDVAVKPMITYKRRRLASLGMHDPNKELIVDEGKLVS